MTDRHDGGPAFPVAADEFTTGMTLRDWFAGQALAGILANPSRLDSIDNTTGGAYTIADAMLMARSEVKP